MLKIGCKDSYNVLHINNEIGQYVIGGAGTYMNEMYRTGTVMKDLYILRQTVLILTRSIIPAGKIFLLCLRRKLTN